MSVTLGKSTYSQLIDDVIFGVPSPRVSTIPSEAFIAMILDAQKRICEMYKVHEKYRLRLTTDVTDYNIQDRPRITAATNATPIVVTATAHGIAEDGRIFIRDVLGNTNCNGYRQLKSVSANAFSLYDYADVDTAVAGDTTVTVTTKQEHPFSTGDSVTFADVLGMTDLDGAFTATVVDTTSFTVPLVTTQTYTSGGVCTKPVAGNGTYTSGGKFWEESEIPTMFRPDDYDYIERTWGNYFPRVEMVSHDRLLIQKKQDQNNFKVYSDLEAPFFAAEWVSAGGRILTVYPAPQSDQDVWLYGSIQVNPRSYYTDAITDVIQLPNQFDEAIVAFVKSRLYERLEDLRTSALYKQEYSEAIARLRVRTAQHTIQEVSYL